MEKGSMSAVYFKKLEHDRDTPKERPDLGITLAWGYINYEELTPEAHGFGGADRILKMAQNEANKEQQLLNTYFNGSLNLDISKPGAIKELVEAINEAFKFKQIYERNKAILLDENFNGQKAVFSRFHTYFNQGINEVIGNYKKIFINDIKQLMLSNKSLTVGKAAEIALNKKVPDIMKTAVKNMLIKAEPELKSMDPKYKKAYQEMWNFVNNSSANNTLIDTLYERWGVDKALEDFAQYFNQGRNTRWLENNLNTALKSVKNKVETNSNSKGGYSLEAVIDQAFGMVASELSTVPNVEVLTNIAQVDARPDNTMVFGINTQAIHNSIDNIQKGGSTREIAVQEFGKIGNYVSNLESGFIVYVNDKNYTLNDNYKGMSAGTDWSLNQLKGLLGGFVENIDQIVYNILQTEKGAIFEGETEDASRVLAEGIAYYLFDDYNTIGNVSGGGQSIHVMGLQGMLIPLSAFLYALGKALNEVASTPTSYVKVDISTPKVNDGDYERYGMDQWDLQYALSMEKIKIGIHFMQDFIGFVTNYLV